MAERINLFKKYSRKVREQGLLTEEHGGLTASMRALDINQHVILPEHSYTANVVSSTASQIGKEENKRFQTFVNKDGTISVWRLAGGWVSVAGSIRKLEVHQDCTFSSDTRDATVRFSAYKLGKELRRVFRTHKYPDGSIGVWREL